MTANLHIHVEVFNKLILAISAKLLCCLIFLFFHRYSFSSNQLRVYAARSEAEPPHKVKLNFTELNSFPLFGFLHGFPRVAAGIVP
jgi:hypothetical protein